MKRTKVTLMLILLLCSSFITDSPEQNYASIGRYYELECGIPTSIQLAQAMYESHYGKSEVGRASNNHFGIRAFATWGGSVYVTPKGTKYRAYKNVWDSWEDHANFLHLHYPAAIGKPWQHWVRYCRGYGGSPQYWQTIGQIIQKYKLYKYDITNVKELYP
jgi:flagellum-specific peptidoglycan hydrolase FlgJ